MTKKNQISGILLCTSLVLVSGLAISKAPEKLQPAMKTVDGVPLPPPIKPVGGVELADGVPLPPPIKPGLPETMVADGVPLPPPIKPAVDGTMLLADGVPLPPPIKPLTTEAA